MNIKFVVDSNIVDSSIRGRFLVCAGNKIVEEIGINTDQPEEFAAFLEDWKNYEANKVELALFKEMIWFNHWDSPVYDIK